MATAFRQRVYHVVGRIPRGQVTRYGLVAMLAGGVGGGGRRAVGAAMRESPEGMKLPCHRVVRADGALAPKACFGGRKRGMLVREGVTFLRSGRTDTKRCEWDGA